MKLTKEQRVKAIQFYYENNKNGAKTARLLSAEYNIPRVQSRNITSLIRKFESTGSVNDAQRAGRPVVATSLEKSNELQESLLRTPQKSSRRFSVELAISDRSVRRMLKKLKMKPYIPRVLQSLHDGDQDRRLQFCEIFMTKVNEDVTFLDKIWWSDEATFKLNGHINRHNCVYWSNDNPHVILEKDNNLPGLTVWAAISCMGLIGPIFFESTVNQDNYLHMLQTEFWPRVENQNDIYFQQDGAPPHYGTRVREWLNENFEGRWIGRRGPIEWPARSPDRTPPNFFLWGVLEDHVYNLKPKTIPELKRAISDEFHDISIEMCQKVCKSVAGRVQNCMEHGGDHFEHIR